jgi:hypothetical protein
LRGRISEEIAIQLEEASFKNINSEFTTADVDVDDSELWTIVITDAQEEDDQQVESRCGDKTFTLTQDTIQCQVSKLLKSLTAQKRKTFIITMNRKTKRTSIGKATV